jgi:hypothetical protein
MQQSIGTTAAAQLAKCDPSTIKKACEKGQIAGAALIANRWLMTSEAVMAWKNEPSYHKTGKKVQTK